LPASLWGSGVFRRVIVTRLCLPEKHPDPVVLDDGPSRRAQGTKRHPHRP